MVNFSRSSRKRGTRCWNSMSGLEDALGTRGIFGVHCQGHYDDVSSARLWPERGRCFSRGACSSPLVLQWSAASSEPRACIGESGDSLMGEKRRPPPLHSTAGHSLLNRLRGRPAPCYCCRFRRTPQPCFWNCHRRRFSRSGASRCGPRRKVEVNREALSVWAEQTEPRLRALTKG